MAADLDAIASRVVEAARSGRQIAPITSTDPSFGLDEAYEVAARVTAQRAARGEHPLGWKIGFTNRTIWDEYDVHAPIWGPMYDTSVAPILDPANIHGWPLGNLVEPRIEPEIVFRMKATPSLEMDERALLDTIDAVAHGFEIVQSIFPGWKFKAADTVAAFALHGAYRYGPFVPVSQMSANEWLTKLTSFEIALMRNGEQMDRGRAADVLDGPLSALLHFVRGLERDPHGRKLASGDLVTTGTVTRAFPIRAGEIWQSKVLGLPLPGLTVAFE